MIGLKPMPRKKADTFITLASVELQKETNWKELLPDKGHLISKQICEDIEFPKSQRKYC